MCNVSQGLHKGRASRLNHIHERRRINAPLDGGRRDICLGWHLGSTTELGAVPRTPCSVIDTSSPRGQDAPNGLLLQSD